MRTLNQNELVAISAGNFTSTQTSYLFAMGGVGIANLSFQTALYFSGPPQGAAGLLMMYALLPAINIAATALSYEAFNRYYPARPEASTPL